MTETSNQTNLASRLLRALAGARDQELPRSAMMRTLKTTAAKLDEAVESLRLACQISVETRKPPLGRPSMFYMLPKKSADESRFEKIGRLIVEAVQLAVSEPVTGIEQIEFRGSK